MAGEKKLDDKDIELVRLLQENAWITHARAGEIVHLSASAVQRRVEKLRADGIITGATATVDASRMGRKLRVYLLLELENDGQASLDLLVKELEAQVEVTQIDLVSGKFDIVLTLDCEDTDSFTEFAMNKLNTNANIKHCWTLMRLKKLF